MTIPLTTTWYTVQGATFRKGWVMYHPLVDVDDNPILDVDGNVQPDLDNPVDLSGCSARMQVRKSEKSSTVLAQGNSDAYDADDNLYGERIFLETDGETGRIDVTLLDTDTDGINIKKAKFDFELIWPIQGGELRPEVDQIIRGSIVNVLNTTR